MLHVDIVAWGLDGLKPSHIWVNSTGTILWKNVRLHFLLLLRSFKFKKEHFKKILLNLSPIKI